MTINVLPLGTRVAIRVDLSKAADDWGPAAILTRREAGVGVVTTVHTGHGLCYSVKHEDDGTHSAYDHHELTALSADGEGPLNASFVDQGGDI